MRGTTVQSGETGISKVLESQGDDQMYGVLEGVLGT